jgi:septation ring formation regulator EzrA
MGEATREDINQINQRMDRNRAEVFQALEKYAVESRAADERIRENISQLSNVVAGITKQLDNTMHPCTELKFLSKTLAEHIQEHNRNRDDWKQTALRVVAGVGIGICLMLVGAILKGHFG